MKNVRSDEIVGIMIEYATRHNSPILKDLWVLSDFVRGIKRPVGEIFRILESMDQSKDMVQELRKELMI